MADDKNAPTIALCEDWWKEKIWPQIDALNCPQLFPSTQMKDYMQKDVAFEDTWIEREMAAILRQVKSTYDKLSENAPLPVWCDDNKTVFTVRQLFVEEILNALGALNDIKPSKILERGYV